MLLQPRSNTAPRSFQSGRYLVQRVLGTGASGIVYEVRDQELDGEKIALKVLHAHLLDDANTLTRFRSQVLLTRQLSHKNIVQVFDFDRDEDEQYFITMELIEGQSLESFLSEQGGGALPFEECFELLADAASALAYAHSLGIVHRDIKPSNLLISFDGEVKLADFGLAKGLESDFGLTQTGETPLLRALRLKLPVAALALIEERANPNICDSASVCPIHLAVEQHNARLIKEMVITGAHISIPNSQGGSALHSSAEKHDLPLLASLLAPFGAGAFEIEARDREGLTALMRATHSSGVAEDDSRAIDFLLLRGARIGSRDNEGRTALMHALLNKNPAAAAILLKSHAETKDQDRSGRTVKEYAWAAGLQDFSPDWGESK